MPVDADELLERAERLPERQQKTREQLMRELEKALDHAESMPKDSSAYAVALIWVKYVQEDLETAARPALELVSGGRDDA